MSLYGKDILIVGGGSGIGFAVAQGALRDGAQVTVASTNAARLEGAAAQLGAQSAQLDITDESAVAAFFADRRFDHIVTTAGDWGGPRRGPLVDVDIEAAHGLFNVRFWGAVKLAKHGAKALREGGSLTLTDGMVAHRPAKGSTISTAMAGAIEHLTRALAVELAPVRVNCVCPGLIRTGVWDAMPEAQRAAMVARVAKNQAVPRVGEPEEVAEAYLFLMRSGFTTGQVLQVEGGIGLGG